MATKKVTSTKQNKPNEVQASWGYVKNAIFKGQKSGLFTLKDSAVLLAAIETLDAELLEDETE